MGLILVYFFFDCKVPFQPDGQNSGWGEPEGEEREARLSRVATEGSSEPAGSGTPGIG